MRLKNYYTVYILNLICTTLYVCLSADFLGNIKLLVPLGASLLLLSYVCLYDFSGLKLVVSESKWLLAFVFLVSIGTLRSNLPSEFALFTVYKIFTLYVFYFNTAYVLRLLILKGSTRKILNLIIIPFFILGALNILLYLAGYGEVADLPSVIAQLIGLSDINRASLFLVKGINSYGVVNGVFLILTVLSFYFKILPRISNLILLGVFFIIAILTDSRGAIIFGAISLIASVVSNKRGRFLFLKSLPFILILAPILLVVLLPQIATSDLFRTIARGDNDIASGNSRFLIWGLVGNDFLQGHSLTFFGLGEGGIYKTDSFVSLSILFEGLEDSSGKVLIHPHNSLIAMILDYGLLTLFVYIKILILTIRKIVDSWKYNSKLSVIGSSVLIYLVLIGSTESFIGYYYQNVIIIYLFVLCLLFNLQIRRKES